MSIRYSGAIRPAHGLTFLVFIYILVFTTAWGHSRHPGTAMDGEPAAPKPNATEELAPVSVPEPGPEAMEYYRSGNWLWTINRLWVPSCRACSLSRACRPDSETSRGESGTAGS